MPRGAGASVASIVPYPRAGVNELIRFSARPKDAKKISLFHQPAARPWAVEWNWEGEDEERILPGLPADFSADGAASLRRRFRAGGRDPRRRRARERAARKFVASPAGAQQGE